MDLAEAPGTKATPREDGSRRAADAASVATGSIAPPDEPSKVPGRSILAVVLFWALLSAGLFLVYEVVDRLFLDALPGPSHERARLLRYAAISLSASIATALFVLSRHVPSLHATLGRASDPAVSPVAASLETNELAVWLVWLRWVAVVVLAGVVVAATMGKLCVAPDAILPLWGGVATLFVLNAVASGLPRHVLSSPEALSGQILGDAALLAWMVHHAGGFANPFSGYFVFNAVIAAIVLEERPARRVIGAMALGIAALGVLEASGLLPASCLVDGLGVCVPPERLHLAVTGVGIATLVYGCPLFVLSLVGSLRRERSRLASAHASVTEEREKLGSIVECMADVVIFADTEGRVRLHNRAALELWASGAPAQGGLRVCHTQTAWTAVLRKLNDPPDQEVHPVLVVGGRSFDATYAPVRGVDGRLVGVVMIARDVTEHLRQARSQLRQERLAVVGQMSASLAHELNNPLSAISLFTQHAMKQVGESSPLHAHLGTVKRNADLCTKILRDLLSYARHHAPECQPVDLPVLLDDVARTLAYKARDAGVALEVEQTGTLQPELWADRDQLVQVLMNLGLNAIEATGSGGRVKFELSSSAEHEVRLDVVDTGKGMTVEQQERVFEPFYTTKAEGTGLGLSIAKGLAEAHGGRLLVDSQVGIGTRFSLFLPSEARS